MGEMKGKFSELWPIILSEARTVLIMRAKAGTTISYSELSYAIQAAHIHPYSYAMVSLLDRLSEIDASEGKPLLATLVVRKSSGRPGPGYFHKTFSGLALPDDLETYWQQQFEAVCACWQSL